MNKYLKKPAYHIAYWIFVVLVLSRAFALSWGNSSAAFYFVCMLLPIVLGTSYFFNYFLVPKYYLTKRYKRFALYTFSTAVVSVYLEVLVLTFSYIFLVNLNYNDLNPNAAKIGLLPVVLYLLVLIGSFLLMMSQISENRRVIQQLLEEKEKMKKSFLEIMSKRKMTKIAYNDIIYIESASNYIKVVTVSDTIESKEKISTLANRLPDMFLRIHRSFIINTERIKECSSDSIVVDTVRLNIGRSYKKNVKESLSGSILTSASVK